MADVVMDVSCAEEEEEVEMIVEQTAPAAQCTPVALQPAVQQNVPKEEPTMLD